MPIQISKTFNAIMAGLIILTLIFDISNSAYSNEYPVNKDPAAYVIQKLKSHDIVFLGTTHKKPAILQLITGLIPRLKGAGISHIGIEMPTDHQRGLNAYLNTGTGLTNLYVHPQIDCPEYRTVLKTLHSLKPKDRLSVVALDLPISLYDQKTSRDKWMAKTIANVFEKQPAAKMLVVVGNFHVFKKVVWQDHVPNKTGSIREYLNNMMPDLRAFSIGQLIDEDPDKCDFTKTYSPVEGSIALDCAKGFSRWRIGVASKIAIKNTEPRRHFDGLIVY